MNVTPEVCPHCGADVPSGAAACPGCGADEKTGWSEEARYDALDLPGQDFDYKAFTAQEFGAKRIFPYGIRWFWWLTAALLLAALAWLWLR